MKGVIMKIGVDRRITTTVDDEGPTLEKLKEALEGGYLEVVPYFTRIMHEGKLVWCVAFCDEDGKQKHLPRNELANGLWDLSLAEFKTSRIQNGREVDWLVGPIVVVFGDQEWMEAL